MNVLFYREQESRMFAPASPDPSFEIEHKSTVTPNPLIIKYNISVTTALEGYASEGWWQRISTQERVRAGEWQDGVARPRYV